MAGFARRKKIFNKPGKSAVVFAVLKKPPKKVRISMRLSPEVFEFFKAGGRGWQTRLDEALKEWTRDRMQFSEM
jgi:uncharacterized protein (DUF4415 family)